MRLKQLSYIVNNWQVKQKKVTDKEKQSWILEIERIDKLESSQNLSNIDIARTTSLKIDLSAEAMREATYWAQRYKRNWLLEGHENSAFFHKVCWARQRRSFITKMLDDNGNSCITNNSIEDVFIKHFKDIYVGSKKEQWFIDNLDWQPINQS